MATATTTIILANDTDAHFRAWCQWIHDRLIAFGWTLASDTGQINLTTVAKPAGTNTAQGYEIWHLADTLQATVPVFLKLEYGSGSAANDPALWFTLATGSNGSGTLTGNATARTQIKTVTPSTSVAYTVFASGDTNRCVFAMPSDSTSTQSAGFIFGIERTKDSAGADNSEGAFIFAVHSTANQCYTQMLTFSGAVPAAGTYYLSGVVPQPNGQTSGVVGADVHTYSIYPEGFYPRNPIMNGVVYYAADISRETSVTLDIYGANHTYLALGQPVPASAPIYCASDRIASSLMKNRLAMRYE